MASVPSLHPWLDPSRVQGAQLHPDPPDELPPSVRAFGFVPTLDRLRAGDLLLVSPLKSNLVAGAIQTVQLLAGFVETHARWHHAAVYVGNDLICEAQVTGVVTESLYKYCTGDCLLRFRRDNGMQALDSCRLALEVALKLKYRYSWASILQLLWQAHAGWGSRAAPRRLSARATICSQLYADAYGVVTKSTLDSSATVGVTPAHLAANRTLADIPMDWLSVPKS